MEHSADSVTHEEAAESFARMLHQTLGCCIFEDLSPNRGLTEYLLRAVALTQEEKQNAFVQYAHYNNANPEYMEWLADRCGFHDPMLFVDDGGCEAFEEQCYAGNYEVAKWLFTKYNLAVVCCEYTINRYVEIIQDNDKGIEMANWITSRINNV